MFKKNSGELEWKLVETVKADRYTVTGLEKGTTQFFKVRARNVCSVGPYSTEITVTLKFVPSPVEITNSGVDACQLNMSWNTPTDDGGSKIIGYKVHVRSSDLMFLELKECSKVGVETTCSVPMSLFYKDPFNLNAKDMISIKVLSYNAIGDSTSAVSKDTVRVQMPPTLPRPTLHKQNIDTIELKWDAPEGTTDADKVEYVLSW